MDEETELKIAIKVATRVVMVLAGLLCVSMYVRGRYGDSPARATLLTPVERSVEPGMQPTASVTIARLTGFTIQPRWVDENNQPRQPTPEEMGVQVLNDLRELAALYTAQPFLTRQWMEQCFQATTCEVLRIELPGLEPIVFSVVP